jgi:hypothetical protein
MEGEHDMAEKKPPKKPTKKQQFNENNKINIVPTGGAIKVKLIEGRYWIDYDNAWHIYRGEEKITPIRWTRYMKRAFAQNKFKIVDLTPNKMIGFKKLDIDIKKEKQREQDVKNRLDSIQIINDKKENICIDYKENKTVVKLATEKR